MLRRDRGTPWDNAAQWSTVTHTSPSQRELPPGRTLVCRREAYSRRYQWAFSASPIRHAFLLGIYKFFFEGDRRPTGGAKSRVTGSALRAGAHCGSIPNALRLRASARLHDSLRERAHRCRHRRASWPGPAAAHPQKHALSSANITTRGRDFVSLLNPPGIHFGDGLKSDQFYRIALQVVLTLLSADIGPLLGAVQAVLKTFFRCFLENQTRRGPGGGPQAAHSR